MSRLKMLVAIGVLAALVAAVGAYAALDATDTAFGTNALAAEDGGSYNSAFGYDALVANTTGPWNTAVGALALFVNTTGDSNTAVGSHALWNSNATGNTGVGTHALDGTTSGTGNTGVGSGAFLHNTTGNYNTAIGNNAGNNVTATNSTGSENTYLGRHARPGTTDPAGTVINGSTAVGANAVVSKSDALVLGAADVSTGIHTETPDSALQIGNGATDTFGDYLQIPVVTSDAKTPPLSDCTADGVGRLVLVQKKKKVTLFACSTGGVWVKL